MENDQILHRLLSHLIPFMLLIVMQNGVLVDPVASNGIVDTNVLGGIDSRPVAHR